MNLLQAAAAVVLWKSGQFDTHDIASAIGVHESDVCRLLDAARERERGPHFTIIDGAIA